MDVSTVEAAMVRAAEQLNQAQDPTETMELMVRVVRDALPEIDHVGVTLAGQGTVETTAATDDFVLELDRIQYELGHGPCVDKLRGEEVETVVENVRHGGRDWPDLLAATARLGVRSMMAVRLFREPTLLGVLNMYSTTHDHVAEDTRAVARMFAPHAAAVYSHHLTAHHLRQALETRELVGQAVGVAMERYGLGPEQAFQYLVRVSSTSETKLREVARTVVASATSGG